MNVVKASTNRQMFFGSVGNVSVKGIYVSAGVSFMAINGKWDRKNLKKIEMCRTGVNSAD